MQHPTEGPASKPAAAAARRVVFGFGVREIGVGVVALAILAATGLWLRERSRQGERELNVIRSELATYEESAAVYRVRMAELQARASELRHWADAQTTEPTRTWTRERARRFEALAARVSREKEARVASAAAKEIALLCSRGEIAAAHARLRQVPDVKFPPTAEFEALRLETYEAPLAEFSRQNPEFYKAFRQHEPEAARRDEMKLRQEIAAASQEAVTPQLMLRLELLAAVAAPDDPVVAEWSALTSAIDYFDNPDPLTLAAWRRAQQAVRAKDWDGAAREMQSIIKSKVRTRQPFRAAFGRALLRSRPENAAEAYPYLAEAAASGDKQARNWVAQEDVRQGRYAQAKRWLEAAVVEGDAEAVPMLLDLHENHASAIPRDPAHDAAIIERVANGPDAPAAASLVLGRMYERGDVAGSTPARAYASYARAAAKGSPTAQAEQARCALRGIGIPENLELARDSACRAFAAGEREKSVGILSELMNRAPDRTAAAVQRMFEQELVGTGGGYTETRTVDGPGVTQLKGQVARYLDQVGMFGAAAKLYAGSQDPAALRRHAELTRVRACQTCGGKGKVQVPAPCPTCGGKGKQICGFCGGSGFILAPGAPPCSTCGGAGTMLQDRRVVACSTCAGTGKGKGSLKQDCTHCDDGHIRCVECDGGAIKVPKDCPECRGQGSWSLAEKAGL